MTESKRQQKFSKLIQKDLGDIFQRDKMGIFSQTFVTIAEVKITPDLSIANGDHLVVAHAAAVLAETNPVPGELLGDESHIRQLFLGEFLLSRVGDRAEQRAHRMFAIIIFARTGAVAVFSLEMSSEQLTARLLSQTSQVGSDAMRRGARPMNA